MKKTNSKLLKNASLFTLFAIASCASDEPDPIMNPTNEIIENLKIGILNGLLEEDFTLNSSTNYQLTGSFIIGNDAVLTIPAGTSICPKSTELLSSSSPQHTTPVSSITQL